MLNTSTAAPPLVAGYREKVLGCWLGKAVGGSLGQSFEGLDGPILADFYTPVPTTMVPNDDLDMQVVYASVLSQMEEPTVDRHVIAQAWRDHIRFPWCEYGVAKRNLAEGLVPPYTGSFDNWYTCGEGAVIRSELWACLAPADPDRAAAYAYEDACFDHAGDGIWAAVFMAALQSYAFIESRPDVLLDKASSLLPVSSRIRQVVHDTRVWVTQGHPWEHVMDLIMDKYATGDFMDTRINTGFVVLGWLASGGDFEKAILITNGCGADTDSSTASVGALMAIIDPESIPDRWLAPIGRELVLNKEVVGIEAPASLDALADQVAELRDALNGKWPAPAPEGTFDAQEFSVPVTIGWDSPYGKIWGQRDISSLPLEGSAEPPMPTGNKEIALPGTWTTWPREEFEDLILVIRYTINLDRPVDGRLMFNCSEDVRVWLDGEFCFGNQPSMIMPTQHRPPAGSGKDVQLSAGTHSLVATIRKPPRQRAAAEWIVSLAEHPGLEWVANAFRPSTPGISGDDTGVLEGTAVR
ncbi:ADP-ribosylglycohydrolase family protein [Pseudarthrobacter sp. YS3]|uniref:ADP-ribosylglycohydrolase family protein n=1 Tax=Pseudarthrobacter sp. YS3 TaxID=3453718 RepID=UPI003EEFC3D5